MPLSCFRSKSNFILDRLRNFNISKNRYTMTRHAGYFTSAFCYGKYWRTETNKHFYFFKCKLHSRRVHFEILTSRSFSSQTFVFQTFLLRFASTRVANYCESKFKTIHFQYLKIISQIPSQLLRFFSFRISLWHWHIMSLSAKQNFCYLFMQRIRSFKHGNLLRNRLFSKRLGNTIYLSQ